MPKKDLPVFDLRNQHSVREGTEMEKGTSEDMEESREKWNWDTSIEGSNVRFAVHVCT
jgi:hypothetical protein